uniref:Methyltransf_11 domain-containing protein n=1 Tax=Ascaris lumbricoides TaxID=6252 RepID=A0A0M3I0C6_ASCLU
MLYKLIEFAVRFYYFLFDRVFLYPLLRCLRNRFDLSFLNLGYEPKHGEQMLAIVTSKLHAEDEVHKPHIYLYEKTLSLCPEYMSLRGKRLLEIGCGHGGGILWLLRSHPELKEVAGVDRVVVDDIDGRINEGSAERIPHNDDSFDIVLNIESSHLYADEAAFFRECARVLSPGGYVCWADLRYRDKICETLEKAHQSGLSLITFVDITRQVLSGVQQTAARYDEMLNYAPWIVRLFRDSLRSTYCAPGTEPYMRLERREKIYGCACWRNSRYLSSTPLSCTQ